MRDFVVNFVKAPDGAWICVSAVTLELDGGRVQVTPGMRFVRGERFMRVDIARLLDEEDARRSA
ncbi:MAG TPA: hypothetical protein VD965_02105 [Burkholderiales bacterium]|nr:hypothetical protein [Burkholderiales bacterium]